MNSNGELLEARKHLESIRFGRFFRFTDRKDATLKLCLKFKPIDNETCWLDYTEPDVTGGVWAGKQKVSSIEFIN